MNDAYRYDLALWYKAKYLEREHIQRLRRAKEDSAWARSELYPRETRVIRGKRVPVIKLLKELVKSLLP